MRLLYFFVILFNQVDCFLPDICALCQEVIDYTFSAYLVCFVNYFANRKNKKLCICEILNRSFWEILTENKKETMQKIAGKAFKGANAKKKKMTYFSKLNASFS